MYLGNLSKALDIAGYAPTSMQQGPASGFQLAQPELGASLGQGAAPPGGDLQLSEPMSSFDYGDYQTPQPKAPAKSNLGGTMGNIGQMANAASGLLGGPEDDGDGIESAEEKGKKNQQAALSKVGALASIVGNFYTGNWLGAAQGVKGLSGSGG